MQKVSAIGTMMKLQGRHAKKISIYYSENGVRWKTDAQVEFTEHELIDNQ